MDGRTLNSLICRESIFERNSKVSRVENGEAISVIIPFDEVTPPDYMLESSDLVATFAEALDTRYFKALSQCPTRICERVEVDIGSLAMAAREGCILIAHPAVKKTLRRFYGWEDGDGELVGRVPVEFSRAISDYYLSSHFLQADVFLVDFSGMEVSVVDDWGVERYGGELKFSERTPVWLCGGEGDLVPYRFTIWREYKMTFGITERLIGIPVLQPKP